MTSLKELQLWLDENIGGFLMPSRSGGKAPLHKHANNGYNSEMFLKTGFKECKNGCLFVLPMDVIVVDIDDKDYAKMMEREFSEFCMTVTCETKKGMHYYFLRNGCDIMDGSRQMGSIPIDFKTKTTTGTSGVISIPPSPDKKWVRELSKSPIEPMPSSFLEFVKKNMKFPASKKNTKNKQEQPLQEQLLTTEPCDNDEVKMLVDMLSSERAEGYKSWIEVGWCLRNLSKCLLPLWISFSKKSKKYSRGECERVWETSEERQDGFKIGSLHMWAKQDNPDEYMKLIGGKIDSELIDCHVNHQTIAKLAYKYLKGKYVCATANGNYWYYFDGTLWKEDEGNIMMRHEISTTIKTRIEHTRDYLLKTKATIGMSASASEVAPSVTSTRRTSNDEFKHLNDLIRNTGNATFKKGVLEEMKEYFYDEKFEKKLDSDINLVAFTNGVWDLRAGHFRQAKPEDYLSLSVGYPYIEEENKQMSDLVHQYWQTLHPDPEQRDYVQRMFARQLYGDHGNELLHIHAGHLASAANGKTKFFDIMGHCLGDYVRKFKIQILTTKERAEAGRPEPEYDNWKGKRILYCTEPNANDMLNTGIMKDLTGGELIQYRLLYNNQTEVFKPQFKMHIMCNNSPQVDGTDSGVKRRIRKIDYVSRFVDDNEVNEALHLHKRNPELIKMFTECQELQMEFLRVLLKLFDYRYSFAMPEVIKKQSKEYIEENDLIAQFVQENVEVCTDSYFLLKHVEERLSYKKGFNKNSLKYDLQKALNTEMVAVKKVLVGNRMVTQRNVFWGFKIVEDGQHSSVDLIDPTS